MLARIVDKILPLLLVRPSGQSLAKGVHSSFIMRIGYLN
jgi:hypothetical protein